jgi:hypothetical protein
MNAYFLNKGIVTIDDSFYFLLFMRFLYKRNHPTRKRNRYLHPVPDIYKALCFFQGKC